MSLSRDEVQALKELKVDLGMDFNNIEAVQELKVKYLTLVQQAEKRIDPEASHADFLKKKEKVRKLESIYWGLRNFLEGKIETPDHGGYGKFKISKQRLYDMPGLVRHAFSDVIILKTEEDYDTQVITFYGLHPDFKSYVSVDDLQEYVPTLEHEEDPISFMPIGHPDAESVFEKYDEIDYVAFWANKESRELDQHFR